MAIRRKVFRIEEGAAARPMLPAAADAEGALRHSEFMTELQALRGIVAPRAEPTREALERAQAQIAEAAAYKYELRLIHTAVEGARAEMERFAEETQSCEHTARANRELAAIASGVERATQSILQAAEEIDQTANTLAASLKNVQDQDLAHDIRDRVVGIFEACNFHDLTSQRVGRVMETLKFVEQHVARLIAIWHRVESSAPVETDEGATDDQRFLNGPRLPDDRGHCDQADIDTMFSCAVPTPAA